VGDFAPEIVVDFDIDLQYSGKFQNEKQLSSHRKYD
jgi:hypothetical protein